MPRVTKGITVYSIRVNDEDKERLLWLARKLGVSMLDVMRYLIRDKATQLGYSEGARD